MSKPVVQSPNNKLQVPNKFQFSKSQITNVYERWDLFVIWILGFGFFNL